MKRFIRYLLLPVFCMALFTVALTPTAFAAGLEAAGNVTLVENGATGAGQGTQQVDVTWRNMCFLYKKVWDPDLHMYQDQLTGEGEIQIVNRSAVAPVMVKLVFLSAEDHAVAGSFRPVGTEPFLSSSAMQPENEISLTLSGKPGEVETVSLSLLGEPANTDQTLEKVGEVAVTVTPEVVPGQVGTEKPAVSDGEKDNSTNSSDVTSVPSASEELPALDTKENDLADTSEVSNGLSDTEESSAPNVENGDLPDGGTLTSEIESADTSGGSENEDVPESSDPSSNTNNNLSEFDPSARVGTPVPPVNMCYSRMELPQGIPFYMTRTLLQQQDGAALAYLTNPQNSGVNLRCEILDQEGTVIYRSGLVQPGYYIERLRPIRRLENELINAKVKISAYQINSYVSNGMMIFDAMVQQQKVPFPLMPPLVGADIPEVSAPQEEIECENNLCGLKQGVSEKYR